MKTLELMLLADVDGCPVPGFGPYLQRFNIREGFKFRVTISSPSYADLMTGLVPSSDVTVRFLFLTTDAAITVALFKDTPPAATFDLEANQLLIIGGSAVESAVAGNPFLRVAVATGSANLTGVLGLV